MPLWSRALVWIGRTLCAASTLVAALAPQGSAAAQPAPLAWAQATRSPQPATPEAQDVARMARCGAADAALTAVARRNLERQLGGNEIMPADELAFTLRAAGDPHAWPRAWAIAGQLDGAELDARLTKWLSGWTTLGVRRCGLARGVRRDGAVVLSAITVDALADIAPLPTTARVGQWIKLEGSMLVPASSVKVVLLGPRGAPKSVLSSLSGATIRSTFAVDKPGVWQVQVLATVSTGPRPVLEALIHAGTRPPDTFVRAAVPGEDAASGATDDADAMLRMMNAARASEQLPALVRDPALEALARAHSEEMQKARMVGHDMGSGDPAARLSAAGYKARVAGENAASSSTPVGAHRAIWASPSHRGNLLDPRYTKAGVAVVRVPGGQVWVTQLFAG